MKKIKLRDFEFMIAYRTKITLFFINTGEVKETTVPNYGPYMNKEVVSIYPVNKDHLRISIK